MNVPEDVRRKEGQNAGADGREHAGANVRNIKVREI